MTSPLPIQHRIRRWFALVTLSLLNLALNTHSGTVRTIDGNSLEGELSFNDAGALVVKRSEGGVATIELKHVARATFASGSFFSDGSILPNGWSAQDLGDTRGFARLDTNTFVLRVEGHSTNATACHFVSRPMPSDSDIMVRVEDVTGNGMASAGLMIRGENSSSAFAALSLGNDGRLWFHRRPESDRKETKLTSGPQVSAPVRLRLQKREKTITALYSIDSKSWVTLATESINLMAQKTWREGEGDVQLLRASCGVFASSRGANTLATARVTPVAMIMHGLLGEYFADQNFNQLRMARIDPQIRFNWNLDSPDLSLGKDNFSVRWTGKLIVPKAGSYRFYLDADDRARLWINETEVFPGSFRQNDKQLPRPFPFVAAMQTSLRMEFEDGEGPASVRLGWALPGQAPEVIGMTNFLYNFTATNSPESIALARATNNGPSVRGVLLRDGTFIAGTVTKADSSAVRLTFAGRKEASVLNSKVARIFLKPPRNPLPYEIANGRSGVFTKSGDFFESEFHSIEHGTLNMSSVLFGLKKFWIEGGDPLVIILNDCTPADSAFEVRLLDGAVVRSPKLMAAAETLTIDEPILGSFSVPAAELFEIRALRSRAATAEGEP